MKIRTLLIISLSLFTIIPIIVYCTFMNSRMQSTAHQEYGNLIEEIARSGAQNLSVYLDSVEQVAAQVSTDSYITESVSTRDASKVQAARDHCASYCNDISGICRIMTINNAGNIIFTTDANYKYVLEKDYLDSLEDGKAFICPVTKDGKSVDFELAVPIKIKTSYLLVFFDNEIISEMMASSAFPTNGRMVIVDANAHLLDTKYVGLLTDSHLREYTTVRDSTIDGKNLSTQVVYTIDKNDRISYTIPVKGTNWYVATLAESKYAFDNSDASFSSLLSSSILLMIVLVAAYVILSILVTEPLRKIEDVLLKISRGDQDARLEIMGRNEYGEIARGFNELVDRIIVSERRYRTIVEMSDDIVFEWSFKTNDIVFSSNFNKKFSYRAPSDHFSDCFLLKCKVFQEDSQRYRADLEKLSSGEEFRGNEYRFKNVYGDYIWMRISTATIRDKDGNIAKIVGLMSDIDRAKKSESALLARASYDSLTSVYNRETIENIIDDEISRANPDKESSALLFLDVDDFKIFNDKYSHATGDQVLRFVADTIINTVKEFGFVGRYGGDEFLICIRNCMTNPPERVAQSLIRTLREGFTCDSDDHLSVNASIGICLIRDNSKQVEEIISLADEAMYRIKKNGKSNYGFIQS